MTEFKIDDIVQRRFHDLLMLSKCCQNPQIREEIVSAFRFSEKAYGNIKRKSGKPYIIHPISVAIIAVKRMGLDSKEVIISAFCHDVVEDTDYTIEDIEKLFGKEVSYLVNGLTKIENKNETLSTLQLKTFKHILSTLPIDYRVVMLKIADRLNNMQTMDVMSQGSQQRNSAETLYIYAPLAHRLGFYNIKKELENLGLKYHNPKKYIKLKVLAEEKKKEILPVFKEFRNYIKHKLKKYEIRATVLLRSKSLYSTQQKSLEKNISFNKLYNQYSFRIIFRNKNPYTERQLSYMIYASITEKYRPRTDKIRDWISIPRANDFEGLIAPVILCNGKLTEIQILSERMHEISVKGFAAVKNYNKESTSQIKVWIDRIQSQLNSNTKSAVQFLEDFRLNLFSSDIYAFTPKSDFRVLPIYSTILDFAFEIHSELGYKCMGAIINNTDQVDMSFHVKNGDIIEIITSDLVEPDIAWLDIVRTGKAKRYIEEYFKKQRSKNIIKGEEILKIIFEELQIIPEKQLKQKEKIQKDLNLKKASDVYETIGKGKIIKEDIIRIINSSIGRLIEYAKIISSINLKRNDTNNIADKSYVVLNKETELETELADCCRPIPGDKIMAFKDDDKIVVHRDHCFNALEMISTMNNLQVHVEWSSDNVSSFVISLRISGVDRGGLIFDITNLIFNELHVNMKSINFSVKDAIYEGIIKLYFQHINDLNLLIKKLRKIHGVQKVERIKNDFNDL